jgi:hypothetical protein
MLNAKYGKPKQKLKSAMKKQMFAWCEKNAPLENGQL